MVRCEGEEKKSNRNDLYGEGYIRGKTKEKGYQGKTKYQRRSDFSNKECCYCNMKGHIQMMCKEINEDLKRIRSLRDGGRKDVENREKALLMMRLTMMELFLLKWEWFILRNLIDLCCSIHICCEKGKFAKLSFCDGTLFTLTNDKRVEVKGIEEVVIKTHDGVKSRLSGLWYVQGTLFH